MSTLTSSGKTTKTEIELTDTLKNPTPKAPLSTWNQSTIKALDELNENFKASTPSTDNPYSRVGKRHTKNLRVKIPSSHYYSTRNKEKLVHALMVNGIIRQNTPDKKLQV